MTPSRHIQRWIVLAVALLGASLLVNTSAAQNTTGDPWKMLILVYRNIDTDYVDIDNQSKHLTATMPLSDAENMVASILNLPHRGNVYEYSANLAELEASVQYIDRPLTDLDPVGAGFWPSPGNTRPELDQYAPPGLYDSVVVLWQASHPDTGQSIPVTGWGLGYWPQGLANGMTYATIFNIPWVWTNDVCEGEIFLHEWLHGVTHFYAWLGFSFPTDDLHGAEMAGYTPDENGCWKTWLADYMQGLVIEDGQRKALIPETWHTGSVTTYDIQGWRAEYYNNETLSDLPVVVRDDAAINFNWNSGSPHPLINADHFSTRWIKDIGFSGGHYLFSIYRNDGLRIFIDGTPVFNEWEDGAGSLAHDIPVSAGWHTVTVEQYDADGPAGAMVDWTPLPGAHETEGNNTPGNANPISDTIHGLIDPSGDVDYYRFTGQAGRQLTAQIEAGSMGSDLEPYLILLDGDGETILTQSDGDSANPRIEATLPHEGTFYLAVRGVDSGSGGPGHIYTLDINLSAGGSSTHYYISPGNKKRIAGMATTPADILRYDKATNTWTMIYDGSARGTPKNVSAFHMMDDGSLLLVFSANQKLTIGGARFTATPHDIIQFTPNNPGSYPLGPGSYSVYWSGKAHELTTRGERIDALDMAGDRLLLSTTGTAKVTLPNGATFKPRNEDAFAFNMTAGEWESTLVIDGSAVPGLARENLNSLWADFETGDYYITISGAFTLGKVKGNAKSIVKLTPDGDSYVASFVDWLAPGVKFPAKLDEVELGR